MKNILLTLLVCFSLMKSNAQAPQGIPYQSVIRNGSGALLINQAVNVRFSIHDSTMLGTIVYQETHTTTTSNLGMITLSIGQGTPSTGMFSSINWGVNSKFMQVELDATGGNNYIDLGTQQMMSVPFALYAGSAGSLAQSSSGITEFSSISPAGITYFGAVEYCRNLVENGHSDWRLPTSKEVEDYIELNGWSSINSDLWTKTIPQFDITKRIIYQKFTFSNLTSEKYINVYPYSSSMPTQCIR
jgi:hypothetical protein